jgi:hypothetical protein
MGDFSHNMYLDKDVKITAIDKVYQQRNIKQSKVHYVTTEAVCSFMQQAKHIYDVHFPSATGMSLLNISCFLRAIPIVGLFRI